MSEFDEIYEDYFFIIDTNNLDDIEQKLYGYCILNDKVVQNDNLDNGDSNLNKRGAYVNVEVNDDEIIISQDYHGSYGIYLFEKDNYFALSNSFIKLVESLKKTYPLTFNKDFADAFLFTDLCAFAYNETLIKEIEMLPRNYNIIINKHTKIIKYDEIDYSDHSVSIDTNEGLEILDNWYYNWIDIIRFLRTQTNNIAFDLSGGFDTRLVATLWLTANINLNNIRIFSNKKIKEDFEISSLIANDFNFELNKPINVKKKYLQYLGTVINPSFYVKLGLHKQMYFLDYIYQDAYNAFTGHGGGNLRGYPHQTINEYQNTIRRRAKKYDGSLINPSIKLVNKGLNRISKKLNIPKTDEYALTSAMYKEGRNRHHFGKGIVESYMSNRITFAPLMDLNLYKLKINTPECDDNQLLITLIIDRYCPKLLDYEVQGGRSFKKETIDYVRKINAKYPFIKKEYPFIDGPEIDIAPKSNRPIALKNPNDFLKDVFYSQSFEHEFEKHYSQKNYNAIEEIVESKRRFNMREVYSSIAIMKIIKDVEYATYKNCPTTVDWLDTFDINKSTNNDSELAKKLNKYLTARIDIKNKGSSENTIEIIGNSNVNSKVESPNWFKDESGIGKVIRSDEGKIHLKIKCIKKGKLQVRLRATHFKDEQGKILPIYIKYTNFEVNDKKILKEPTIKWHNDPYSFNKDVEDSEIINLTIDWEAI